jgi:hypothetical protein
MVIRAVLTTGQPLPVYTDNRTFSDFGDMFQGHNSRHPPASNRDIHQVRGSDASRGRYSDIFDDLAARTTEIPARNLHCGR